MTRVWEWRNMNACSYFFFLQQSNKQPFSRALFFSSLFLSTPLLVRSFLLTTDAQTATPASSNWKRAEAINVTRQMLASRYFQANFAAHTFFLLSSPSLIIVTCWSHCDYFDSHIDQSISMCKYNLPRSVLSYLFFFFSLLCLLCAFLYRARTCKRVAINCLSDTRTFTKGLPATSFSFLRILVHLTQADRSTASVVTRPVKWNVLWDKKNMWQKAEQEKRCSI